TNPAGGKVLRGHRGEVRALQFVAGGPADQPLLVSAAIERAGGELSGALRLWDAKAGGKALASVGELPSASVFPGLPAWGPGAKRRQVRGAVAWQQAGDKIGYLRLWDADTGKLVGWEDGQFNNTAALMGVGDSVSILTGNFGGPRKETATGRLRLWRFPVR